MRTPEFIHGELQCLQELDVPCVYPDSYSGEVNLKAGGRGYIADNFSAQALSVRVNEGSSGSIKLKTIRRKRGWTIIVPQTLPQPAETLILRFYRHGKLHSKWLVGPQYIPSPTPTHTAE